MSVVISSPVTTGVVGAINCIKKLRMNAPSILGTVDLYFLLTTSKRLYFTANPAVNAPQEISLSAIPFLANATLHGMEVMVATESDANGNVKYPVVYLFGREETGLEFDSGINVTKPFVAVVKCGGLPTQPPTVTIYWPCVVGAPSAPTEVIDPPGTVEFVGYEGPTNPELLSFFGGSFGRSSVQAAKSGLPLEANAITEFWQNGAALEAYAPALNIVPEVRFSGLGGESQVSRLLLMRRVGPPATQLTLCEVWAETDDDPAVYPTVTFSPVNESTPIVYALIDAGMSSYLGLSPIGQADLDWMEVHGVKQIVIGWGLSGSDDPDGQTDIRIYGDVSVVILGTDGHLRICGDGAGTLVGLDTPAGDDQPISAVEVGYQGTTSDADTSGTIASVPLYRNGVVLVSGRYVFYSANGLTIGAAVLILPEPVANDPLWDVALTFSVQDSIYSAEGEEYYGAPWRLTVVYTPVGGGAPQVRSYKSVDGETWSLTYSHDFASTSAPSGTTSRVYSSAVVKDTGEDIVVAVGRTCVGASTTPKQIITWRYANVEGYGASDSLKITLGDTDNQEDILVLSKGLGLRDLTGGTTLLAASGKCGYFLPSYGSGGGFFWGGVDINLDTVAPVSFGWENVPEWSANRDWDTLPRSGNPPLSGVVDFFPYIYAGAGGESISLPYGVINTPTGVLVCNVFTPPAGLTPLDATDIYGVRSVELAFAGATAASNNGWGIYSVVSSPEKGSVIFWKAPNGAISAVSFTDPATPLDFERPAPRLVPGGPDFTGSFTSGFGIGFFVNDVFSYTPGNAPSTPTTIYITDTDGRLWAMLPGATAQMSLVSEYFLGKQNVRLARAGEAWVISYDGLDNLGDYVNTMVEFSFNLTDWFVGVPLNGSSHPGMVSRAKDIIPLGPSGNVERIIPDAELGVGGSSIFVDQIP